MSLAQSNRRRVHDGEKRKRFSILFISSLPLHLLTESILELVDGGSGGATGVSINCCDVLSIDVGVDDCRGGEMECVDEGDGNFDWR